MIATIAVIGARSLRKKVQLSYGNHSPASAECVDFNDLSGATVGCL